jgi:SAM-dependent methyltransferase
VTENPNAQANTEDFEFAALQKAENYRAALIREFTTFLQGRVVEIGAGIGQMTSVISRLTGVRELVPIEPEARFCEKFRQLNPTLAVREGTIDSLGDDQDWNAIISINVLEHIGADEEELAKYQARLAKNRGHLCLFVPARQEIYAPIDKDFGHFRRYSRPELRAKLERAGFEIVRLDYFNSIGYFAWWFNFCLLKKREFDVGSVVLFDRCIFPVVHALERTLLRPPFGQSLIACGASPASERGDLVRELMLRLLKRSDCEAQHADKVSALLFRKIKLLHIPQNAVHIQRRAAHVAQIRAHRGERLHRHEKNHRLLLGENRLDFVVMLHAFALLEGVQLQIHQFVDARFPGRRGSFLLRKPLMAESARTQNVHAERRVCRPRAPAEQVALPVVPIVQALQQRIEIDQLHADFDADLFQVLLNERRSFLAAWIARVRNQRELDGMILRVFELTVAIAIFNFHFREQLARFRCVVRILRDSSSCTTAQSAVRKRNSARHFPTTSRARLRPDRWRTKSPGETLCSETISISPHRRTVCPSWNRFRRLVERDVIALGGQSQVEHLETSFGRLRFESVHILWPHGFENIRLAREQLRRLRVLVAPQ